MTSLLHKNIIKIVMRKLLDKIFFWMKKDAAESSQSSQRLFLSGLEERMSYNQESRSPLRLGGASGSGHKESAKKPEQRSFSLRPNRKDEPRHRAVSRMAKNDGRDIKMAKGKVKWFNNQKGYGFIVPDNTEIDVFVHYSTIQGDGYKTLNPGQEVEFEIIKGDKGEQAQNVMKV